MSWKYEQTTGNLIDPSGKLIGKGYSGNGADLDNSSDQQIKNHGPIPQGLWTIQTFVDDPGGKGLLVTHLTPAFGTNTFGRTGFMIHGDNSNVNHTASEGCIILAKPLRELISSSTDRTLEVTE